ncbi:MAG: hypothetical protein C0614_13350 [Desulfuromonas sp.]|nr:MAG: hypothetical protein C0614_13350 [Desulfuromonas sp.]
MMQKKPTNLIGKISSYLQILSQDPHSTAFVPLAEAYRQVGMLGDALEVARFGVRNLPHFSPGFSTLGRIYAQIGRHEESFESFHNALEIDGESHSALVGLARLHLMRSEREKAREILEQAARFHQGDEVIENMVAALSLPRPWMADAEQPVVEASPPVEDSEEGSDEVQPIPTATLAEIYVKQGLFEQAISVYQQILNLNPDSQTVRQRLEQLQLEIQPPKVQTLSPVLQSAAEPESVPAEESEVESVDEDSILTAAKRPALEILESLLMTIKQRRADV